MAEVEVVMATWESMTTWETAAHRNTNTRLESQLHAVNARSHHKRIPCWSAAPREEEEEEEEEVEEKVEEEAEEEEAHPRVGGPKSKRVTCLSIRWKG